MHYSKRKIVNIFLDNYSQIKRNLHSKHTSYHIIGNEYLNIPNPIIVTMSFYFIVAIQQKQKMKRNAKSTCQSNQRDCLNTQK